MNSFSTNLEYHRYSYIAITLGKIVQLWKHHNTTKNMPRCKRHFKLRKLKHTSFKNCTVKE